MGSPIPIHIIWKKDANLSYIFLQYSRELFEIKEIYNVDKSGIILKEEGILINLDALETKGYIGFVLGTKFLNKPYTEAEVIIKLLDNGEVIEQVRGITKLFRPYIVVDKVPRNIILEFVKDSKLEVSNKIQIKNIGYGTAFIKLTLEQNSDVKILKPEEIYRFSMNFYSYLSVRLKELENIFLEYSDLLNKLNKIFYDLLIDNYEISEKWLRFLESTMAELIEIIIKDEEFARDLSSAIVGAYLSTINVITEFRSLYEYLKSLMSSRVVFLNAFDILELYPGSYNLKGKLQIYDLASNVHKPIIIETTLNANSKVRVPVYELFDWVVK